MKTKRVMDWKQNQKSQPSNAKLKTDDYWWPWGWTGYVYRYCGHKFSAWTSPLTTMMMMWKSILPSANYLVFVMIKAFAESAQRCLSCGRIIPDERTASLDKVLIFSISFVVFQHALSPRRALMCVWLLAKIWNKLWRVFSLQLISSRFWLLSLCAKQPGTNERTVRKKRP
jgi:hypothetical protein